jgi:hypothetical protein
MDKDNPDVQGITVFTPYPFRPGQKINITEGPRRGDWVVAEVTDKKVRLRCPVSYREFDWDRFCYFVKEEIREE